MFPYLPQRAGYNKRLRSALLLVKRVIRELASAVSHPRAVLRGRADGSLISRLLA